MKREDFLNITEEHRKICEEVLNGRINCNGIRCRVCMFYDDNSVNFNNCVGNKYSNSILTVDKNWFNELFIKSCKLFLKTFFNDIEKEEVLKIESQEVFDSVAFRIVYQNEEVLKRGEFKDYKINVFSAGRIGYYDNFFYIRGSKKYSDSEAFVVSKEQFKEIENKVKLINEKYGTEKRWRAEKGGVYFYVNYDLEVNRIVDDYYSGDNSLYKAKNYFKTREVAEKVASRFREVVKECRGDNE